MISYATLAQLESELGASGGSATEKESLLNYGRDASNRLDSYGRTRYEFAPRLVTLYHNVADNVRARPLFGNPSLRLRKPFLSITSVYLREELLTVWDGDYSTQADADYMISPLDNSPITDLVRLNGNTWLASGATSSQQVNAIKVTGFTGYRYLYSEAWKTGSTLTGNIISSATSIAVTSGTPFSAGMLLRIDSEFIELTGVSTNTLTVVRGVRGTTSASHSSGANVEYYIPEPVITRAVTRYASYMLKRQGNFSTYTVDALGGASTMPSDMPTEVKNILDELPLIPFPFYAV